MQKTGTMWWLKDQLLKVIIMMSFKTLIKLNKHFQKCIACNISGLLHSFNMFISEGKQTSFGKFSIPDFCWHMGIVSTLKFPVMTRFANKHSFLFLIPYFLSLDSFLIFSYEHSPHSMAGTRKQDFL